MALSVMPLTQLRYLHTAPQVSPKHSFNQATSTERSQKMVPSSAMMASLESDQTGEEEDAKDVVEVASDADGGLNAKGKAKDVVENEDSKGQEGEVKVVWV